MGSLKTFIFYKFPCRGYHFVSWLDTERLSIVLDLFKLKESDLVGNVGNKR